MKKMTFGQFKEYCKCNYINYATKPEIDDIKNLMDYVLSNDDPWFHIENSIFYILHLMGVEVTYVSGEYVIYQENKNILPQISIGDYLRLIEGKCPNCAQIQSYDKKIHILFESKKRIKKEVSIYIPQIQCLKHSGMEHLKIKKGDDCLRIKTFFPFDQEMIRWFVLKRKKFVIDLQECSGGSINDMLNVARFFAPQKGLNLYVVDAKNFKFVKKINSEGIASELLKINWLVGYKTASSAEVFCVLLREQYAGTIYGGKTVGKFVIQEPINVDDFIVEVPIYRVVKPKYFYQNIIAQYDGEQIVPEKPFLLFS